MQPARSGTELDISFFPFLTDLTIPQASTAEDTLFAIERRDAIFSARDSLPRTHLDTEFRFAGLTEFRAKKGDVIGITGRCLDSASHKKRVLVRDQ